MSNFVLSDADMKAIEQGEAASFLLDDARFLAAIDAVRAQCAEAILQSPPTAKAEREDAYNLSRALSAITAELTALAARGAQVAAEAEQQSEPVAEEYPGDHDDTPY